jgi:hypothetical protein
MITVFHNPFAFGRDKIDWPHSMLQGDELVEAVTKAYRANPHQSQFVVACGFTKVAVVEVDDLDKAYELTNSIDHHWSQNPGVIPAPGSDKARSTSMSDILQTESGMLWVVATMGFEPILAYDSEQNLIEIGDDVEMPDPQDGDAWNQGGFVGRIDAFKPDLLTVVDMDGDAWDVEPNRVRKA